MLSFLEIAEQSQKSPKMVEQACDIPLFLKIRDLLTRHAIPTNSDNLSFLYTDDSLRERVFQAGVSCYFKVIRGGRVC